jgi:hypothetical protein
MIESRRTYGKSYEDEGDYSESFQIGSHMDPESQRNFKMQAQRAYQQQLEDDKNQKYRMNDDGMDYPPRNTTNYNQNQNYSQPSKAQYNDSGETGSGVGVGLIGSHQDPENIRRMKIVVK